MRGRPRGDKVHGQGTRTQDTSFTNVGFREIPASASNVDDAGSVVKSVDTT